MAKDFLPDSEETSTSPASSQPPTPSNPEREPVQILVIGSKEGLSNIVHSAGNEMPKWKNTTVNSMLRNKQSEPVGYGASRF
jgi:hypothetical protein